MEWHTNPANKSRPRKLMLTEVEMSQVPQSGGGSSLVDIVEGQQQVTQHGGSPVRPLSTNLDDDAVSEVRRESRLTRLKLPGSSQDSHPSASPESSESDDPGDTSECPWGMHTDPKTGDDFYYNSETQETSWDEPANFAKQSDDGDMGSSEEHEGAVMLEVSRPLSTNLNSRSLTWSVGSEVESGSKKHTLDPIGEGQGSLT